MTDQNNEIEQVRKFLIDIQAALFKESISFNSAVIGAGYVATFTLWHFAKDYLSPAASNWAIVLLGLSMLAYMGWTVLNMVRLWVARFR